MNKELTTFHYMVNSNSDVRKLEVKTGVYQDAVAAIPALTGLSNFPIRITIWCKKLLPKYGPYEYIIERDEYGHTIIRSYIRRLRYTINGVTHTAGWDAKLGFWQIVGKVRPGRILIGDSFPIITHTDIMGRSYTLSPGCEVSLKDGMRIECAFMDKA